MSIEKDQHSISDIDAGHPRHPSQQRTTSSGLKGFFNNPFVFGTALFASIGGCTFGYDIGVISGVQEMETFMARFPMNSTENGFVVAILELGAWAGAWLTAYPADRFSRKYTIVMACLVFLLGSALQGGAQTVSYLMAGRFICGLGVGSLSMLVPMYQSEIAPPEVRGSLVSLQQFAITIGILVSFWINFGTQYINSEAQWRIPLCLQLILGLILGIGILFFPFSPRWLMSQGREEEALKVLSKLRRRAIDDPVLQDEWRDIKISVEFDKELERHQYPQYVDQKGFKARFMIGLLGYRDLFRPGMFNRVAIASIVQFFQQFCGTNSLIYYAPKIFQSLGLEGNTIKLLATGVVGIINVVATIPTVLFLDKMGRKPTLMVASIFMTLSMAIVAVIQGLFDGNWVGNEGKGWGAVACMYFFIANYAYSWGPVGWVITAEIFPLRARAKGMSIATSSNWMNNFIIAQITPPMLENIGFGTYIFFACFCLLSFFFTWFFIPETKGCTLEEMDELFGGGGTAQQDNEILMRIEQKYRGSYAPAGVKTEAA
ncbi:general substrate transporter [Lichtheimia corymbifera JMRC:FSU:9682]|uniref:General substrate transporter n=1 Tax=Lichtheimia corymbifera JMRC:FSU:9682 TaxID=1263082 RepID=A0A068S041_9FUNG|nr:general substrate transporter [Lichtheimia corymbifera JMRC:FSU:9682]